MVEKEPPIVSSSDRETMLREIAAAEAQTEWVTYEPNTQYGITVRLPHGCFTNGTLTYDEESNGHLYLDMVRVPDQLHKQGIGPRLLQSLVTEGKKYDAVDLSAHVTGPGALKAITKVVGEQNVRLYNYVTGKQEPHSVAEALQQPWKDYVIKATLAEPSQSEN